MKVLIIGLGSIAKKHLNILREIRSDFHFYALRSNHSSHKIEDVVNIYSWDELENNQFDFAIISSPSFLHEEHIIKLSSLNIPLMVEKPLCINKGQLVKLDQINFSSLLYVAFNMRFHPLIIFLKNYLTEHKYNINEVNAYFGSYLPNWRSTDYKSSYSSHKKLGGGVHLDLIHEPDYLMYLFGLPNEIHKNIRKISNITTDSYDYANICFDYNDFSAQIVLNYFRKETKRTLEIVFEETTLEVDFVKGTITDLNLIKIIFYREGNLFFESYKEQMNYWLNCIKEGTVPINNFLEAKTIIEKIL